MAGFCTKCGTPLGSNAGFCSSCGKPVGSGAVSPQSGAAPPPPAATVYPPGTGYPGPPPAKSSGGALKIILIVLAAVVGLGVLALGGIWVAAWRVSRTLAQSHGGTVTVPGVGSISAGNTTASPSDLGVPYYPGAVMEKGGIQMNTAEGSMVMAHFSTKDSMDQVVSFYKDKMGDGITAVSGGTGTVLNSGNDDTGRTMITVGPGNGDDAGKTTIVIMHTTKKGV